MNYSKKEIVKTFTEWERRYREEPSKFESDFERLSKDCEDYGEGAANYFCSLIKEITHGL